MQYGLNSPSYKPNQAAVLVFIIALLAILINMNQYSNF